MWKFSIKLFHFFGEEIYWSYCSVVLLVYYRKFLSSSPNKP